MTASFYDADGHVMEVAECLEPYGWTGTGSVLTDRMSSQPLGGAAWKQSVCSNAIASAFDPGLRVADMDAEGIAASVCYPSAMLSVSAAPDADRAMTACRAYNDWFSKEFHQRAPERLYAVASVTLRDIPAAVAEVKRAVTELGAVGVVVPPYMDDLHLDDPAMDVFWGALQELGVPAGIHGGRSVSTPHLQMGEDAVTQSFKSQGRFYAMVHPFHQMFAMADLALGGVFARFPRLKVAFLEAACGWMPTYIARLDETYESFDEERGGDARTDLKPSEYLLSGNCWFSCEGDEPNLSTSVNSLGENQVVFASDYPHFDCSFPDSVTKFIDRSGLSDKLVKKVGGRNVQALYGI